MAKHKGLPIRGFRTDEAWAEWLQDHHRSAAGLWIRFAKKGSGKVSVTYEQARDTAIAFGWIDGLRNSIDETSYAVRFTPRRPKSKWSVVNQRVVQTLIAQGRMRPAGQAQVDAAKADGRWQAAYPPQSEMEPTDDFLAALDAAGAREAFEALKRSERFAMLVRLFEAKRPETRARHMARFVEQLTPRPGATPRVGLPAAPGTYLLGLASSVPLELEIGRAGVLRAPPGVFLYAGSALGPGGLRARLGRHLEGSEARRWHIDHLRAATAPVAAWFRTGRTRREHRWAKIAAAQPGATVPLPGFGASDSKCDSHLVWLPELPDVREALGGSAHVGLWTP